MQKHGVKKYSKNFKPKEFYRGYQNFTNSHSDPVIDYRLAMLCEVVLEKVYKKTKIEIFRGYLTTPVDEGFNTFENNTQHQNGEAVDIKLPKNHKNELKKLYVWMLSNCVFDQLIFHTAGKDCWIHVSYTIRRNLRMEYGTNRDGKIVGKTKRLKR